MTGMPLPCHSTAAESKRQETRKKSYRPRLEEENEMQPLFLVEIERFVYSQERDVVGIEGMLEVGMMTVEEVIEESR